MFKLVKISDLEKYFEKDFVKIIEDKDIVLIAENKDFKGAYKDYYNWEIETYTYYYEEEEKEQLEYLKSIEKDFYEWLKKCNGKDLLESDLDTYQRHFVLEDNNIYYLNSYL